MVIVMATKVTDRETSEDLWLSARRRLVTASESAHLMGMVKGPWALDAEALAAKKRAPWDDAGPLAAAGSWWESHIMEYFQALTGLEARGSSALYRSDDHPFMGATPDGFVGRYDPKLVKRAILPHLTVVHDFELFTGDDALGVLHQLEEPLIEVKNQESKRRSKWNKEAGPPAHYICQVQHQMLVMQEPCALLVAKVDANELYVHVVEADPLFQELLVDVCGAFAKKFLTGDDDLL